MKLKEFKTYLSQISEINFILPDGKLVPNHFHVTEVGQIDKKFIDCGGTIRFEKKISFQLWEANDFDHRLAPQKLADIISLSENKLGIEDGEIEVEYQGSTIGKYNLGFNGKSFLLEPMFTDCLASDKCGIPAEKQKIQLKNLSSANSCTPGSGCCN